ncbi:putative DNA oxidative demethylase, DNA-(apurinic or apyrimidinic site) lyase [Helianthus annuus]|nr:putative DNA oxidative demethylase, DNA-(apurinic or apyrimidinic site) lyase [Helianthus annuus]
MLGGHLDDMEADWSKPIVSMSLGCKAIFLLGGKSRNDEPLAMFLRSGDIVLMSGEARERFHGRYINSFIFFFLVRVKYTNGPCGLPKFWIWSLAFQKYTDGPCGLHFVTHLVPNK